MNAGASVVIAVTLVVAAAALAIPERIGQDRIDANDPDTADATDTGFSAPQRLGPTVQGFEPTIDVGPDGTLYVTAHKSSRVREETNLSSLAWYAADGGETWHPMPSPANARSLYHAQEPALAVDDAGNVYMIDINSLGASWTRWTPGQDGPVWQATVPYTATEGLDDRPWLSARGDGIVYLVANEALVAAATTFLPDVQNGERGNYAFHASFDGGLTWSLAERFPGDMWCHLTAPTTAEATVHVGCQPINEGDDILVHTTHDHGTTWETTNLGPAPKISHLGEANGTFPSLASDAAGNAYMLWVSDDLMDGEAGRLELARSQPTGGWDRIDITPWEGSFSRPWIAAGSEDRAAVIFFASPDVPPGPTSPWFPHVLITDDATAAEPTWTAHQLDTVPADEATDPQRDFIQVAIGPDDRVHAVYHRDLGSGDLGEPAEVYYVGQHGPS